MSVKINNFPVIVPSILHSITLFELIEELFADQKYEELRTCIYKIALASMIQNLAYLKLLPKTKRVVEEADTRTLMYNSIVNRFMTKIGQKYNLKSQEQFK